MKLPTEKDAAFFIMGLLTSYILFVAIPYKMAQLIVLGLAVSSMIIRFFLPKH